jgi:predicted phage baseplate assembly protein
MTGNRPPQSIVQLKTTVPYIDRVTNYDASTGGAEAETFDALQERLPRSIRHSDRAVTLEDYEDIAMLATPEVARAKSVPLRNLVDDPLDQKSKVPGDVSIIIVPRSKDLKPLPSTELINHVKDYLEAHAIATSNIFVVGPLYVKVSVEVEIGLTSLEGASAVEQAVQQKLTSFLHPLTGGLDGNGWDFGREPYKSDFYALLEAINGVDHVRTLVVREVQDAIDIAAIKNTGRFLVYSDKHKVSLFFENS